MVILWTLIFIVSLAVVVKSADWLLDGAERIGVAVGFSPFIVGVLLVGVGTSFPELISGITAIAQGAPEIVAANAVGSNIANILLVVGFAAVLSRQLVVTKSLIDLDLPLVALSTVLFLGVVRDGIISRPEAVILILGYVVYFFYTLRERRTTEQAEEEDVVDVIPPPRHEIPPPESRLIRAFKAPKTVFQNIGLLVVGAAGLALGAKYLIEAVVTLSGILGIATGAIALAAVAFGTSLPEVLVSIKAARQAKSEVVLGNIFGSNVFNTLAVVGIPGIFTALPVDTQTLFLGVPVMIAATVLFVISGISRQIHNWEGFLYILIYILFIGKLFGLL